LNFSEGGKEQMGRKSNNLPGQQNYRGSANGKKIVAKSTKFVEWPSASKFGCCPSAGGQVGISRRSFKRVLSMGMCSAENPNQNARKMEAKWGYRNTNAVNSHEGHGIRL